MQKKMNKHLAAVVTILNDGECHAGNQIGKQLKMTRSAVWKYIHRLKKYDVDVRSIKGKGYQLATPLILLAEDKIKKTLPATPMALDVFESIGSTNEYLKARQKITAPAFCIAEHQTHGKARLDRAWYSPFGKNIYLSCRYPFYKDVSELAGLSLIVGLAVFKTLQSYVLPAGLAVKWPNDIYYQSQKLAGILLEVQSESQDGLSHAIIGIGINVNQPAADLPISQSWASLQTILQRPLDRNELCGRLIHQLLTFLQKFENKGFAPFIEEWQQVDCLYQQPISLKTARDQFTGKALGVNSQGQLVLELAGGQIKAFSSGDVTITKNKGPFTKNDVLDVVC